MFRNYIKVALRNLLRDRMYAAVNIFGLAAGLAVSMIVFLYIQNELSYDTYNTKADRIYRIGAAFVVNGEQERTAVSPHNIGPALELDIDKIEAYCRLHPISRSKFSSAFHQDYEEAMVLTDPQIFDVFSYRLISGDPKTCLQRPKSIVLTESLAKKYFGDREAVGQVMTAGSQREYVVTGVMEDLPKNTHHYFEGLVSYGSLPFPDLGCVEGEDLSLWSASDYTFLLFEKGFSELEFNQAFASFYQRNMAKIGRRINGYFYPILQPLTSIHLGDPLEYDRFEAGSLSYIYGFTAIGLFLLLLAGINYMNMATARSVTRAREVGLRKVMGSRRHHLVVQFLGESVLASFMGLLLALALVEVVLELTPFNTLMGKSLKLNLFENPVLGLGVVGVTLLLGVLSGLYPAIYLSSFVPARALRLRNRASMRSLSLRRVLVIFQFTISIGVIVATILMKNQVDYMRNVDLGFNDDNTVVFPIYDSTSVKRLPQIRKGIEKLPGVLATTTARHVPGGSVGRMVMRVEQTCGLTKTVTDFMEVGRDYLPGMGLKLVQGRDFGQEEYSDSTWEFVVNKTAEREFFGGEAIGKQIEFGLGLGELKTKKGKVVGVVKDFNVHSLRYEMRPLVLTVAHREEGLLYVRLDGSKVPETMALLESRWGKIEAAGSPFNPIYINDKFEKLYQSDRRLSSLMGILAYICVLISILGLLGFASYAIVQRHKEIGIRKVLGASLGQIVLMLFREIFYLILVASMLGSILGFLVVQFWLQQYAYQAEIPVATFFMAGIVSMALAFLTVSFHSIRAALANPVHALKYE